MRFFDEILPANIKLSIIYESFNKNKKNLDFDDLWPKSDLEPSDTNILGTYKWNLINFFLNQSFEL